MSHPFDETADLISAGMVIGTPVFNAGGDKLGTLEAIMLNKRSGVVAYAVMSFGGVLGLGRRHHPVPWDVLSYDTVRGGYVIDRERAELEAAPTLDPDEADRLRDPAFRQDIDRHYRR